MVGSIAITINPYNKKEFKNSLHSRFFNTKVNKKRISFWKVKSKKK